MSVNLPRSGHPMVTVNRTVLCSRVSSDIFSGDKKYFTGKYSHTVTRSIVQNLFKYYSCSTQCNTSVVWCVVLSWCDSAAAILQIHRKAFNTFAIQCFPLSVTVQCTSNTFYWILNFCSTEVKYILPIQRNIFYFLREIHSVGYIHICSSICSTLEKS